MERNIYTVFDTVANEAGNLFTAKNDEVAIRQVRNSQKDSPYINPDDYKLYHLGTFDFETLIFTDDKYEIEQYQMKPDYPRDPALPLTNEQAKEVTDLTRKMFENAHPNFKKLEEAKHAQSK